MTGIAGVVGELNFTLSITNKEGETRVVEMVGAVNEEQLKQLLEHKE